MHAIKPKIIAELENMVADRLFGRQPCYADGETRSAVNRKLIHKLIQMGLMEEVPDDPLSWRITPLGKELDVELFQVFMGLWIKWEVPIVLEEYGLFGWSEFDAILECPSEADADRLLSEYVKRAYFDYRKHRAGHQANTARNERGAVC
jgi:hypothetical protein